MRAIGKVYLVGAGPGDPELLTLKAHKLIRQADAVLHDDLVSAAIVSLAGPQAHVVNVGKRCGAKKITQDEINAQMIDAAQRGRTVVRLKSGDPSIFGRLAEEIDALTAAAVPFEVIPGITAGVAAAAALSCSLTDRRKSARIVIVSGYHAHENQPLNRTDWKGLAREDATLVIYMPGQHFSSLRQELLEAGLAGETPAVIVSRATAADQQHFDTTLMELDKLPRLESPSILLIGRSLDPSNRGTNLIALSRVLESPDLILS